MCGIFACKPVVKTWLKNSTEKQYERGPDQSAHYIIGDMGVAVNRLAITGSLEEGAQPIFSKSKNSLCVFNGAIYNTEILIKKFSLDPKSTNDAAVALELFELVGKSFLDHLEGMFSIIVIDIKTNSMLVARDVLGIKPLYYAKHQETHVFASSLKAIPADFLPYAKPFPPGLVWIDDNFSHEINPQVRQNKNLEQVLISAIESHIPKEVAWGCSLSGGVDSSVICALAKDLGYTFNCYVLDAGGSGDPQSAKVVADHLKLPLKFVKVTKDDIKRALPVVIEALATYNSQLILGGLATYFISRAAAKDGLKVMLFGEGADEIFGGYRRYKESSSPEDLHSMMIEDQNSLWLSHNKRVDHASMAASIEVRVPFRDLNVIGNSREIPIDKKVDLSNELVDKICLRQIALKYLPKKIAGREKITISSGSGLSVLVAEVLKETKCDPLSKADVIAFNLRNQPEMLFLSMWKKYYPNLSDNYFDLVNRNLFSSSFN